MMIVAVNIIVSGEQRNQRKIRTGDLHIPSKVANFSMVSANHTIGAAGNAAHVCLSHDVKDYF